MWVQKYKKISNTAYQRWEKKHKNLWMFRQIVITLHKTKQRATILMDKNSKIVVVCGGVSSEREVSLRSGKAIYEALLNKGYANTVFYDLTRDNMNGILDAHPDIVFLGLHGKGGEDGTIQGMLEFAGIPYTGPGVAASAVCMDKVLTKRVLENTGIPTPHFVVVKQEDFNNHEEIARHILSKMRLPMVLKPPCEGSSIGIVVVKQESQMPEAIAEVLKHGDTIMAEEYLEGVEITLPILGNHQLTTLPIIEISSDNDFYDYTSKYVTGLCHHIIPACIDKSTQKEVEELGKKAYRVIGCCGLSCVDFIVDSIKGPMIIEINTLPGMTDMSIFPDAARYMGISYEELVERILELGWETKRFLN